MAVEIGKFEQSKKINELEYKTVEIIKSEEQGGEMIGKSEQSLRCLWESIKKTNIHIMVSKAKEKENGLERILKK